jgi:hypothetical protein
MMWKTVLWKTVSRTAVSRTAVSRTAASRTAAVLRTAAPRRRFARSRTLAAALGVACFSLPAGAPLRAQDVPSISIPGGEVAKRVEKVMAIYKWDESLESALARAEKEKKLVFWLDIVGELDGGL